MTDPIERQRRVLAAFDALVDLDGAAREQRMRELCGDDADLLDQVRAMLAATSKEDYVAAVRALDRVLISGNYVVPLFYAPDQWVARRAELNRPNYTPLTGAAIESWWHAVP